MLRGHTMNILPVLFGCGLAMAGPSLFSTSASIVGDCVNQSTTGARSASLSVNNGVILTPCADGNYIVAAASAQSNGSVSVNSDIIPIPGTPSTSLTSTAALMDTLTFCPSGGCVGPAGTLLGMGTLTATLSDGENIFGAADLSDYASFTENINDPVNSVTASGTAELAGSAADCSGVSNCTVFSGGASVPLTVSIQFAIYAGEAYEVQTMMTSFSIDEGGFLLSDPLSLTLPEGVTFTSASGEFASIPEPSSWMLVAGGLALFLGKRGRINPAGIRPTSDEFP